MNDGNMIDGVDISWIERRQEELARQHAARTQVQSIGIEIGGLAATAAQIAKRHTEIKAALGIETIDDRLIRKVARAVAERRISEGSVARILAAAKGARNVGGYFVSAIKSEFGRQGLPWHEEAWT